MLATMHHLMGAAEIAVRLGGLSRQRVQQIVSGPGFPKPETELMMGKVWKTEDVEAWIRENRPDVAEPSEGTRPTPRVTKGRTHPKP